MTNSEYTSQQSICPVCNGTDVAVFVEIPQVPVHCNLLWASREEAIRAERGDLRLGFCRDCGHIFNLAFDPASMAYGRAYENSLHFSPRFQVYAGALAARLIDRYDLRGKDIIEIGCGKGDFLRLLCERGDNHGVGFDPGYVPERTDGAATERITFIQDFYSERYAGYKADLICCRHVLEHVRFPRDFLRGVRRAIGDQQETILFFEVPNVLFTLRDWGIWDMIYEHCSYFSANSLAHLFTSCGFEVCDLMEAYEGQFLCLEASPREDLAGFVGQPGSDLQEMTALVTSFADKYRRQVGSWRDKLEQMAQAGERAVVWGGGSKGVTFLNTLEVQDQIEYVVDINPRKQGVYIAGTGQRIVPPEFLRDYQPDVVVVMNPIYEGEIRRIIERLGLTSGFVCAAGRPDRAVQGTPSQH